MGSSDRRVGRSDGRRESDYEFLINFSITLAAVFISARLFPQGDLLLDLLVYGLTTRDATQASDGIAAPGLASVQARPPDGRRETDRPLTLSARHRGSEDPYLRG